MEIQEIAEIDRLRIRAISAGQRTRFCGDQHPEGSSELRYNRGSYEYAGKDRWEVALMRIDDPSERIAAEIRLRNPSRTMKIMLRAKPQFDFCPVCLSMPGEISQKIQEFGC